MVRLKKFGGDLSKLSRLQRYILSALLDVEFVKKSDRQKNAVIYQVCFGGESPAARSSVSRAWKRLEHRGYIERYLGAWMLTDGSKDLHHCGQALAWLVYADAVKESRGMER
jgi:hypothetical protein